MSTLTGYRAVIVAAAVSLTCSKVSAQTCQPHWESTGPLSGIDGSVEAAASWDPDGDGPDLPLLVAAGNFDIAGSVQADHIAAFDVATGQWQTLGNGFNLWVNALTIYDGHLIAGGAFNNSGGIPLDHIASWDGKAWSPIGAGIGGTVRALCTFNGELIAAGSFSNAGGDSTIKRIARWDGQSWHALGTGLSGGQVDTLTVHNDQLIAGGTFTTAGGIPVTGVAA